ncbi:unnamed protein product [Trichogramma brassicae]|uniref:Uncharacterized protein n=1 Tax=Trichogramma brassicae TaxID=86971 RepID=A0A6H5J3W4_9HYME|nr:unnamed protein product [Trichogramma brassicae]
MNLSLDAQSQRPRSEAYAFGCFLSLPTTNIPSSDRPGKENVVADCLSRNPIVETPEAEINQRLPLLRVLMYSRKKAVPPKGNPRPRSDSPAPNTNPGTIQQPRKVTTRASRSKPAETTPAPDPEASCIALRTRSRLPSTKTPALPTPPVAARVDTGLRRSKGKTPKTSKAPQSAPPSEPSTSMAAQCSTTDLAKIPNRKNPPLVDPRYSGPTMAPIMTLSNDGRSHRRYKHPAHKQQPRIILRGLRISGTEKGNLASRHLLKYYGVDQGTSTAPILYTIGTPLLLENSHPKLRPIQNYRHSPTVPHHPAITRENKSGTPNNNTAQHTQKPIKWEILDVTTTYHPEDYTKTITIRYYPYVYQGTTPAPAPAPMTTPQQEPLAPSRVSPTTPSQQPEAEDTDNQCSTQTNDDQNDRIFCTIPPSFPTSSIVQKLLQYFSPYGRIEYYNIIKINSKNPHLPL